MPFALVGVLVGLFETKSSSESSFDMSDDLRLFEADLVKLCFDFSADSSSVSDLQDSELLFSHIKRISWVER